MPRVRWSADEDDILSQNIEVNDQEGYRRLKNALARRDHLRTVRSIEERLAFLRRTRSTRWSWYEDPFLTGKPLRNTP